MATARAVQSEGVLPGIAPQREPFLDIARGIGILLVLYGHSLEWLFLREDRVFTMSAFLQWRVLYAFHMPVFFLISGAVNRRIVEKRPREVLANALGLVLLANLHHLVAAFMQLALDFRRGTPVPLKFIPQDFGNWNAYIGVTYIHTCNPNLTAINSSTGADSNLVLGYAGLGFGF